MSSEPNLQENKTSEIKDTNVENEIKDNENQKKSKFNILEQGKIMILKDENSLDENSKNLIIIGPKKSGKTTIFNLLSTGETHISDYTHTCGINYGFMRLQKSKKKLINIYEIGGGIENLSRISTLVNNKNLNSTLILLILDFQTP